MKKFLMGAIIFFAGMAFGLILANGTLRAQDTSNAPDIMSKLNDIVKSEEQILAGISSLKEDMQIVKIRVTQLQ